MYMYAGVGEGGGGFNPKLSKVAFPQGVGEVQRKTKQ